MEGSNDVTFNIPQFSATSAFATTNEEQRDEFKYCWMEQVLTRKSKSGERTLSNQEIDYVRRGAKMFGFN